MTDFGSLPNLRCLMTNDDNLIDGNEMHLLACSVYHSLLKHLPALVTLQLGQNSFEFAFEFEFRFTVFPHIRPTGIIFLIVFYSKGTVHKTKGHRT